MHGSLSINAQNFRAIGPVRTRDGRTLKPGTLYRSGDLSEVTDACVAEMEALGIRSVVDLRSVGERQAHPYDWLAMIDQAAWGDPAEHSSASLRRLIRRSDSTVEEVAEGMCDLYRTLLVSHAASYTELFRRVAEGRTPVLFGCAAGKDRTGVGAALLLWSIDVEPEDIMDDYLLSNRSEERLLALATRKFGWDSREPKVNHALRAVPAFLEAMIDEVTTRHGGIDRYVAEVLGISTEERASIQRHLLG